MSGETQRPGEMASGDGHTGQMMAHGDLATPPEHERGGAAYLRQVEELRQELEGAMQAISGNRLSLLEESLWRQQVLCTGLKHLSHTLSAEDAEEPLMRRIREASTRLAEVNRIYTSLVQQAAGSTDLLLRLCRNYRDEDVTTSGRYSRPAWTCEA